MRWSQHTAIISPCPSVLCETRSAGLHTNWFIIGNSIWNAMALSLWPLDPTSIHYLVWIPRCFIWLFFLSTIVVLMFPLEVTKFDDKWQMNLCCCVHRGAILSWLALWSSDSSFKAIHLISFSLPCKWYYAIPYSKSMFLCLLGLKCVTHVCYIKDPLMNTEKKQALICAGNLSFEFNASCQVQLQADWQNNLVSSQGMHHLLGPLSTPSEKINLLGEYTSTRCFAWQLTILLCGACFGKSVRIERIHSRRPLLP